MGKGLDKWENSYDGNETSREAIYQGKVGWFIEGNPRFRTEKEKKTYLRLKKKLEEKQK
jgi:hypothetical protein